MSHVASAPGKMMVSGEYAVLDGAPAIVAAVQARALARLADGDEGAHLNEAGEARLAAVRRGEVVTSDARLGRYPESAAARRLAELHFGVSTEGALAVDVGALRSGGVKLGLGSSAAAAAASAAVVAVAAGLDPADHEPAIFRAAFEGHALVAPQGSGADVAASVHGGFVAYRRPALGDPEAMLRAASPLAWPASLTLRIAWTGHAASTRELVGQVRALKAADPTRYAEVMGQLRARAEDFVTAVDEGADAVVAAAARYHAAMKELGEAAGAPIVEARLAQVAALAAEVGGSAKPSGAGGGDVALAFFADEVRATDFEARCADAGIEVLALPLGGPGVTAS